MNLKLVWFLFITFLITVLVSSICLVTHPPLILKEDSLFSIKAPNQVEIDLLKKIQHSWKNKSYDDVFEISEFIRKTYPDYYVTSNLKSSQKIIEDNYFSFLSQKKWMYEDIILGSSKIIQAELISDNFNNISLGFLFNHDSIYQKAYLKLNNSIENCPLNSGCVLKVDFPKGTTFLKVVPQDDSSNIYIISDYKLIFNLIMDKPQLVFNLSHESKVDFDVKGIDRNRFN